MTTLTLAEPARLPTSYYQRDWVRACVEGRSYYSLPIAWDVTGPLDAEAVRAALTHLTDRHAALRTGFRMRTGGTDPDVDQIVQPSVDVDLEVTDLGGTPDPDGAADAHIVAEAQRPRELQRPPLWHGSLLRLGPDRCVLALFMHHLIFDGWSHGVLHDELVRCYRAAVEGRAPRLPRLSLHLGDHTAAERGRRDAGHEQWWRERLRGLPPLAPLPPVGGRFICAPIAPLPARAAEALRRLAADQGGGLNTALLATLLLARRRQSGDDQVIGVTRAGRDRPGSQRVVGPLLDHLPVRVDVSRPAHFAELVADVARAYREALAHRLPLGRIRQVVPDDLTVRRQRLFDTRYNYLPAAAPLSATLDVPGGRKVRVAARPIDPLRLAPRHTEDHPEVLPLSYNLRVDPDGAVGGEVCGHDGLYPRDRLAAVADEFAGALAEVAAGALAGQW
ncbi:condensation domain-containing protein [Dactylosporangium sp. CA-139066]|uniref:condensation domain-containing protein n=1 Tax=Dactylosporangium sp. CA-139066 TaxID=3239930 RepID=UPI003D9460E3